VGCPAFSLGEKAEIKPRECQSLNSQPLRNQRLRDNVYIAGKRIDYSRTPNQGKRRREMTKAKNGDTVKVHYTGKLEDGTSAGWDHGASMGFD